MRTTTIEQLRDAIAKAQYHTGRIERLRNLKRKAVMLLILAAYIAGIWTGLLL